MSIAVRIVHAPPEQAAAASGGGYLIDQVPDNVPLWDPFDFSSLAQSQRILERLHAHKAVLVIEGGYSLSDEGSTLSRRPHVEGDDSLGWYLFGSGHGTGLLPLFVDRSCAHGGSCWLSLIALNRHNKVVDLIAPYLPHRTATGGSAAPSDMGQKGSGRHHSGATTMMFTSSRALHVFLTTKLMSSVSFQKKRPTLSFVVTASNANGEYLCVLVAHEAHHHAVLDVVFPRANAEQAHPSTQSGEGGGLSQRDAIKGVVSAFEDRCKQAAASVAAPVPTEPFLIVRIPRSCQSDTLGIAALLQHAASIPAGPGPELELSAVSSVGAVTPHPQTGADGAGDDFIEVSQWQQRVDACRQGLQELERDLQDVLRATERVAVEHRDVHDSLQLCREELASTDAAIGALEAHNRTMQHEIKRHRATRDALGASERTMSDDKAAVDAQTFKTMESERRELHEMAVRHAQRLEQLRRDHDQKMQTLSATHESKASSIQREQQRGLDELKATIRHADENITLSIQNGRRLEAEIAERQEQAHALQLQMRALDDKNQALRDGLVHVRQHAAKRQLCLDQLEHVQAAMHDLATQVRRQESMLSSVEAEKQRLASQLRKAQADAAEAEQTFAALCKRHDAMQRSALLAEAQAGREALHCEAQDHWHGIRRRAIAAGKVFQDRMVVLSSERAMTEVLESIAAAQAQEASVLEETDAIEADVQSLRADLEGAMATQERELAVIADECNQTLLRIEELRKLQRSKFMEREGELKSLRQTYQQLFQEFLAQIEDETSIAIKSAHDPNLSAVERAHHEGHIKAMGESRATSRTASPVPTNPSQGTNSAAAVKKGQPPLTNRNLAQHRGGLAEHDASHWDTCVLMYLQWAGEMAKNRDVEAETRRLEHKIARTEAASLSVAESLAIERQRLADVEAELARTALVDVEAKDALDEFVAKAAEQRQQMEDAIAALIQDGQSSFKELVEHVNTVQGRIKTLETSIDAAQAASGRLAFEIEGMKPSDMDLLQRNLVAETGRTQALEARLASLRQQQRANLGLTPGFYSLEETSMRSMGIPSMRDPDHMFEPSLMLSEGNAPSRSPRPVLGDDRTTDQTNTTVEESSSRRSTSSRPVPSSVAATQATTVPNGDVGRSDSVSGTCASSSGVASYVGVSRQSTRPSTPPSSVFYFGSADDPSGLPSIAS